MKISVCCPSYKRPKVETLDYLPFVRVYVDNKEYDEYVNSNPKSADIVSCPNGIQGNLCRVRNYILDEEFKRGVDVVLIIDDDMRGLYYWENKTKHLVKSEDFKMFIEKYSILAKDLGVYFWGVNVNQDKQIYREYSPFSTTSYIGGPFQCFLKGGSLRYDERLPLKEDYDMTLQQLNKYRKVLRVNKFFYEVKQSEQKGGCATYRNFKKEEQQLKLLQKKWGSDIVKQDKSNRSHNLSKNKNSKRIDYNPIIKAPIKGI